MIQCNTINTIRNNHEITKSQIHMLQIMVLNGESAQFVNKLYRLVRVEGLG